MLDIMIELLVTLYCCSSNLKPGASDDGAVSDKAQVFYCNSERKNKRNETCPFILD